MDIDPAPLLVEGDPARLQQIQANLLSNASKYSPRGARVHLEIRRHGEFARLVVSDEGRGIEPDMLPRVFDLFVQGQQSIARQEGGLGIGLTLLRSLVELHDGRVEAESDGPDRGSRFTVWLPLAHAASADVAASRQTAAAAVRTIVIVEDQADARRMLQLLFESQGVMVFAAQNGVEGVELIERLRPDLALVDLGLPVMSLRPGADDPRQSRERAGAPRGAERLRPGLGRPGGARRRVRRSHHEAAGPGAPRPAARRHEACRAARRAGTGQRHW